MKFKDKSKNKIIITNIEIAYDNPKYLEIKIIDENKKSFKFYAHIFNIFGINVCTDAFASLKQKLKEQSIYIENDFKRMIKVHIKEFMMKNGIYFIGL